MFAVFTMIPLKDVTRSADLHIGQYSNLDSCLEIFNRFGYEFVAEVEADELLENGFPENECNDCDCVLLGVGFKAHEGGEKS